MKKTENINISGIRFHIDEDAYNKLNNYMEIIKSYFTNSETHKEIISDIETEIAKMLQPKISEQKQSITIEDINEVISIMGEPGKLAEARGGDIKNKRPVHEANSCKKLYRDPNNKILGGVCSGVANYFGIDPIWTRICLLFFPLFFLYIILWIIVPLADVNDVQYSMEANSHKKLFRNPDNKILGGVCGGIGAYLNIDPVLVRITVILLPLVLVYIILWIVVPLADTDAKKAQMYGAVGQKIYNNAQV